jgi:hypothetical protein
MLETFLVFVSVFIYSIPLKQRQCHIDLHAGDYDRGIKRSWKNFLSSGGTEEMIYFKVASLGFDQRTFSSHATCLIQIHYFEMAHIRVDIFYKYLECVTSKKKQLS